MVMSKKQTSTVLIPNSLLDLITTDDPVIHKEVDYRVLSFRLFKALKRLIGHESTGRWTQAPFPKSQRLGCQFCEQEWINHKPDCLFVRIDNFLKELEPIFKP